MLRACLLTLLVAATLSGYVPTAAAAAPAALPEGAYKGTLQVTLDPQVPATAAMDTISAMLTGGAVSREAAVKVCEQLKVSKDDKDDFKVSDATPRMVGTGLIEVEVLFAVPERTSRLAGPFLTAVAKQVERRLQESQETYKNRLGQAMETADRNLERVRKELSELRAKQRDFYEKAGRTDLSRESVLAEAKALETEQQKLQMDQIGHAARYRALTARIAQIAAKAEARAAEDPVAAELKKIVDLREQELDRAKQLYKTGQIPTSEVGTIEIKVAEARAEWLKRREAAGSLAGRDLLAKLNEELSAIEVDNAETTARLEHIRDQLAKNRAILPIADECQDSVVLPLKSAEREVQNARMQLSEAEKQLRAFAPATVVAMPPK